MYQLRNHANGDVLDEFSTFEEALNEMNRQEEEDIRLGHYVEGESYYEIYNSDEGQIEVIQNQ